MRWKTIATWKPKNAVPYYPYLTALVYADGEVQQAHWKPGDKPPTTGEWWPANLDSEYGGQIYPTHWAPMPKGPV